MDEQYIAELLKRIATQDESALRELQDRLAKRIYAFVENRLHVSAEVEEVVCDTLYEVWRSAQKFRGESKPSTWIFGIAKNKAFSKFRSRPKEQFEPAMTQEELEELIDEGADCFEFVAKGQIKKQTQLCLDCLSPEQRECLSLVYFDGYSLGEVAELQSCPEGTVKTRLFHARKKITSCLKKVKELL